MSSTLDIDGTAERLDATLRAAVRGFDHMWGRIESLIAEAKTREIHKHLGFKSWPDYIADVAGTEMPNVSRSVEQRRQVVALLTGEGMSQRSIADAVGVNHATISRDQQVLHDATPEPVDLDQQQMPLDVESEPPTVTGRDGKTYPKPKPQERQPKRSNTFADRFYRVLSELQSNALRLEKLTKDEAFAEHINEVCRQHRDGVVWVEEVIVRVLAQMRTDQAELFGSVNDEPF